MNESNPKEKSAGTKRLVPQEISSRVGQEILEGKFEPGTYARALAAAKGDHDAVSGEYARLRIAQLMRAQSVSRGKTASLEVRRLNACLGVKTVRDILNGVGKVGVINIPRPRVPWIWMILLVLGLAGCTATATRMVVGEIPDALRIWVPVFSLGCGVTVVIAMMAASQFFSRSFVAWAWGPGIVGLSSVVCIGSMMLGAKLMVDNPYAKPADAGVSQQPEAPRHSARGSNDGVFHSRSASSSMMGVAVAD